MEGERVCDWKECDKPVDETTPHQTVHEGETYYFCSADCKQKFDVINQPD